MSPELRRVHVEGWDPAYGSPVAPDDDLAPSESEVDLGVEVAGAWAPLPGEDDGIDEVWLVDGIRRVEARLSIASDAGMPVGGICGSHAVGAVRWDRVGRVSTVAEARIDRLAVTGAGRRVCLPPALGLEYRPRSVPGTDPAELVRAFHGSMRTAEARLTAELADTGSFVIADGPVNDTRARDVVGFIKTHRVAYLHGSATEVIARLEPGTRTPLFLLGASGSFARYSWYQRRAEGPPGPAGYGGVRCEVAAALGLARARILADRTAVLAPRLAAPAHTDPRAPQNLVPIGALERGLRRRLGDQALAFRALAGAAAGATVEAA
ncbi:MAG: hypothetical protein AB1Z57_06200 [Acidimicrobiia bacterium]